jgi:hypothetical protein
MAAASMAAPAAAATGPVIEIAAPAAEAEPEARRGRAVPASTARRWLARLQSSARQLLVLLASTGTDVVCAVAESVGLDATRRTLIDAYTMQFDISAGRRLAVVGALVHRLERGIRLM